MVIEKKTNPVKGFIEKIGKRNLVIMGAVLLIGAAVCLNFVIFGTGGKDGYSGYDEPSGVTGNTDNENLSASDSYFASAQVSRKRARDEAMEVLQSVIDNKDAAEAVKTQAMVDLSKLAMAIEQEANIETLIMAKGFEKCVAVISGDTARIIVSGNGLTAAQIAQINEIVYDQTKITPANITITEKN